MPREKIVIPPGEIVEIESESELLVILSAPRHATITARSAAAPEEPEEPEEPTPPDAPEEPEPPDAELFAFVAPQAGETVSGEITLAVRNTPSGTAGVWFQRDNWVWLGDDYRPAGGVYQFTLDTRELSDGPHTFIAQAVDRNDVELAQVQLAVMVDNQVGGGGDREPDPPAGPGPLPNEPDLGGTVIWATDHESGNLRDWERNGGGGAFDNGSARSTISTDVARSGRYSLRLSSPGRNQGARTFRWREPQQHDDLVYSAWYYFPAQIRAGSWWSIMQWKSEPSYNAKFMLLVRNRPDGAMYLTLGRGQDSGGGEWGQSVADIPVGRWFNITVRYRKASNTNGRVMVYQDGVLILDLPNVATANPGGDLGWAVISYGEGMTPTPAVVYVDDAEIRRL